MLTDKQNLKIELMSEGMSVSDKARTAMEGVEKRPLTTGDYASTSGIILNLGLGDHIFANVPFHDLNPNFVGVDNPMNNCSATSLRTSFWFFCRHKRTRKDALL